MKSKTKIKGFSLIEMAMVLVIFSLLLGGLLLPLSAQVEQKNYAETKKMLEASKEALMGYALSNKHLPCPDKTSGAVNGINDRPNDGVEDFDTITGFCIIQEGNLPWSTLSLDSKDSWNQRLIYRVSSIFSVRAPLTTFGLTANGSLRVCNEAACIAPRLTDSAVAVILSKGKNQGVCSTLPSLPACADERENDDVDNDFVSHELRVSSTINPNIEYDDVVVWVSSNILVNRMVAAGQLP